MCCKVNLDVCSLNVLNLLNYSKLLLIRYINGLIANIHKCNLLNRIILCNKHHLSNTYIIYMSSQAFFYSVLSRIFFPLLFHSSQFILRRRIGRRVSGKVWSAPSLWLSSSVSCLLQPIRCCETAWSNQLHCEHGEWTKTAMTSLLVFAAKAGPATTRALL